MLTFFIIHKEQQRDQAPIPPVLSYRVADSDSGNPLGQPGTDVLYGGRQRGADGSDVATRQRMQMYIKIIIYTNQYPILYIYVCNFTFMKKFCTKYLEIQKYFIPLQCD